MPRVQAHPKASGHATRDVEKEPSSPRLSCAARGPKVLRAGSASNRGSASNPAQFHFLKVPDGRGSGVRIEVVPVDLSIDVNRTGGVGKTAVSRNAWKPCRAFSEAERGPFDYNLIRQSDIRFHRERNGSIGWIGFSMCWFYQGFDEAFI